MAARTVNEREFKEHFNTLVFDETIADDPSETLVAPHSDGMPEAASHLAPIERSSDGQLILGATIGEGGMGIVRSATQPALGREVAVKSVRKEGRTPRAAKKLLAEAWITGQLEHPNVVPIHALGLDEHGAPLIVMKLVDGVPWTELISGPANLRERLGAEEALNWHLDILQQLCNVLHFAHSKHVVHRDLKPDNVMIGQFGEVYLVDWGIAVSVGPDPDGRLPRVREDAGPAGTPSYMAPEMVNNGSEQISPLTDVYLLGSVLHEILTGEPPHKGRTLFATMMAAFNSEPPEFDDDIPEELAELCHQAMSKEPADRPTSAEEFRHKLVAYDEHRLSRQLSKDASDRVSRLLELTIHPEVDEARRRAIYSLFSECKYAFRASLEAWSENPRSDKGLKEAAVAIARFELRNGDPRAARAALVDIDAPLEELRDEISALEKKQKAEADHTSALAKVGADLDPNIGQRTRAVVTLASGLVWATGPLFVRASIIRYPDRAMEALLACDAVVVVVMTALFLWARESLTKTEFNRRICAAASFVVFGQLVLITGLYVAGFSIDEASLMHLFLWFSATAFLAIAVDKRVWMVPVAYLIGFLAASFDSQLFVPAAVLTNGFCALSMFFVWKPDDWNVRDLPGLIRGGRKPRN